MKLRYAAFMTTAMLFIDGAAQASGRYEDPNRLTIENGDGEAIASYTVDELKANFAAQTRDTGTPWTPADDVIRFRGVFLKDVLAGHGLDGEEAIEIHAYDDFRSVIHMSEIEEFSPILALERACTEGDRESGLCEAGQEFRSLRFEDADASGPIFIVWPMDQLPGSYVPGRNSIWVFFVVAVRPG